MSTVNVNNKVGHPVAGIVLGILGIAVALLMTLLFGVIAGAVAGVLGIVASDEGAGRLEEPERFGCFLLLFVPDGFCEDLPFGCCSDIMYLLTDPL